MNTVDSQKSTKTTAGKSIFIYNAKGGHLNFLRLQFEKLET
jgi:hypothetical protein